MQLNISKLSSPIGEITIIDDGMDLFGLDFEGNEERLTGLMSRHWNAALVEVETSPFDDAITSYFGGHLHALCRIPTRMNGTEFQMKVWQAIRAIKLGKAWSYGDLASYIGHPGAARAVGAANGQNPVALVHPCHRIIGADGSLTGFAGGLERKKWLLAFEKATCEKKVA